MFSPREAETYKQNQHPIALTKQVNKSTSQQVNKSTSQQVNKSTSQQDIY